MWISPTKVFTKGFTKNASARMAVASGIASRLSSTHRPRLRQWEKGGYAAEQPYMPMLGPLSLSRLLLRWASLACSCCHSATLGEAMTAFTVRAT